MSHIACLGLLRQFLLALTLLAVGGSAVIAQSAADYGSIAGAAAGGAGDPPPPAVDAAKDGEAGAPGLADYGVVAEILQRESALEMTQQQVGVFRQKARRIFGAGDDYFSRIDRTLAEVSPNGESAYFLGVALFTCILLAIGRAGGMIFALYLGLPIMRRLQKPHPVGMVEKLPVLAARVGIQFCGVAITLLIALAVGSGFYQDQDSTLKTVIVIALAYAMIQLIDVLWRMVISPYLPDYRVPALSNAAARRLYRWLASGATFGVLSILFTIWLKEMGADEEVLSLTNIGGSTVALLIFFGLVWRNGRAITSALLGGARLTEATWVSAVSSVLWAPAAIGYMVFGWGEMAYRVIMGLELGAPLLAGAFVVLLVGLVVYAFTVYVIEQIFRRARTIREANEAAARADFEEESAGGRAIRDTLKDVDDGGDEDGGDDEGGGAGPVRLAPPQPFARRGMRTFEDLAHRVASLFALGAGIYALFRVWLGSEAFLEDSLLDRAQGLIDVVFIGYVTYHAARIWMDRKIEQEGGYEVATEPGDEGGAVAAASRLATILPLFRSFVLLVILVAALLMLLTELGVNIAPLVGGAGVVGLAIGFGAQSLVRDILSGVFFLSDDAFRKGEYIDIGGVKGTVEKISLRSFQLRHHLGALNTVPFGEIQHLTNYSRDWVMMKLPLRLTYDTDVDKVRKLIKNLGVALLEHPIEGKKFVQPLKSQGVYMMEDSAMIFRVKFMTRPGDQWTTRKLVYQEIRTLFAKEGVKFAHKEVTVRIPGHDKDQHFTEDEQKAIGAAARGALEDEARPKAPADDR